MPETNCPKCGAEVPADAPGGICPKCLLQEGLESTAGYEGSRGQLLEAGEQFGSYRIGRLLGKGGMGAVYEAEDGKSGRRVALKVLNHKLQSTEHRQRFLREGRLAASVNHPNSVYIYGTEEIEGTPVIAMELAGGGTLQDRVKRSGPLAIGEAVDVILDIIAGLEAARAAGVLHRDVKPANCFVDADGTVKIGDFGLSISRTLRGDTNLTHSGVFLGTPAFSSPEQLRGDELDVRSDIYSVGVTLYYLLTGEAPFQAAQMVQLLATVLERPAPSPRSRRPAIPAGLARIVRRCLAKQSTHRFRDYDELRQALLPYRSAAPTPGTLGFRVLASGIDFVVIALVSVVSPLLWARDVATWQLHFNALSMPGPQPSAELMWLSGLGMLLYLIYFALLEGIWGASAGKAICRLRVVGPGREAPGIFRALVRTTVFAAAGWLPWWVLYAFDPELGIQLFAVEAETPFRLALWLICSSWFLLLFVTMRRHNGYAGVHELASATRVVRVPAVERRPTLSSADDPLPEMQDEARIGPYHVLGPLESAPRHELILAYDTRLLRKVWIHKRPAAEPSPLPKLRELARIGRLRWLNGQRDGDWGWDAYEAPSGKPLLKLIDAGQPWDAVRFWLLDLAQELSASRLDETLPPVLDLDRVWITADGRAKLLDFPAPGLAANKRRPLASSGPPDSSAAALFLKRVAIAALEGRVLPAEDVGSRNLSARIPLPARALLNGLGRREDEATCIAELESLTRKPASVSAQRRVGALAACWLFPLMMAAFLMTMLVSERQFLRKHPEVGELAGYVGYYRLLDRDDLDPGPAALSEAVEIFVADRFRETITDPEIWADPSAKGFVDADDQRLLKEFVEAHPSPSPEQVAEASKLIQSIYVRDMIHALSWSPDDYLYSGSMASLLGAVALFLGIFVVLPSLASALLLGDTLLLRFLEVAVVDRAGARASRLRLFWRNMLLWSIVLLGLGLLILLARRGGPSAAFVLIIYWIVATFTAQRGLHDRLAGTWLVPR
ncbi:MAG: protein kinase [Pirellulales bacterium]